MSKGSTPIKVLRTALKRVQKGWTQHVWVQRDPETGKVYVCLEGALFGYCEANAHGLTEAQVGAKEACLTIIKERFGRQYGDIPTFNDDRGRTQEEVMEVIKLAIIRLETTGDGEIDPEDEDFDNLLEFMDSKG